MKKIIIFLVIVIVITLSFFYIFKNNNKDVNLIGGEQDAHGCLGSAGYSWCEARQLCIRPWEEYCTATVGKTVTFFCDTSKSITATFYPTDDKFVDLKLSDNRNMSVPHAVSASGARYAKPDESFVFWNKGDTAFVTEGASSTQTYSNCVIK
jgi:membrane-bound inhibitor of C-type lysozyme